MGIIHIDISPIGTARITGIPITLALTEGPIIGETSVHTLGEKVRSGNATLAQKVVKQKGAPS